MGHDESGRKQRLFAEFCKLFCNGWSELDIFMRIGFLAEETGEVARAIRALEVGRDRPDEIAGTSEELKQDLVEELGDVLGNIIVIANKYDISLEHVFQSHRNKLQKRYLKDSQ